MAKDRWKHAPFMWFKRFAILSVALILAACGQGGEPGDRTSLHFPVSQVTVTQLGQKFVIIPVYTDSKGQNQTFIPSLKWSSSNPSAITVDNVGRVDVVAVGHAVIQASLDERSASYQIEVSEGAPQIEGNLTYPDKRIRHDSGFLSPVVQRPLRRTNVRLLTPSGSLLSTTQTDDQGRYAFNVIPDAFYIEAETIQHINGSDYTVRDMEGATHRWRSSLTRSVANSLDFGIDGDSAPAFHILDTLFSARGYLLEFFQGDLPSLKVFWQKGVTFPTSYCESCSLGAGVYLDGGDTPVTVNTGQAFPANPDEYDDDAIWHEYFHVVAEQFSRNDSPGGCHRVQDNTLDLRLAWNEGVADYFPVALKNWLQTKEPYQSAEGDGLDWLVDVKASGQVSGIDVALKGQWANDPHYIYSSNEIAIANILNTLRGKFGDATVMDVLRNPLWTGGQDHDSDTESFPHTHSSLRFANLELFWDVLTNTRPDLPLDELRAPFLARQVNFVEDTLEPNDMPSQAKAVPTSDTVLTLYHDQWMGLQTTERLPDVDYFVFPIELGKTYEVSTVGLSNGADTMIEVSWPGTSSFATSDNINTGYKREDVAGCGFRAYNDAESLASSVVFGFDVSGLPAGEAYSVIIKVSSANVYPQAGRYGSYRLKITEK